MFNLEKFLGFWFKIILVTGLLLVTLFFLSVLTESSLEDLISWFQLSVVAKASQEDLTYWLHLSAFAKLLRELPFSWFKVFFNMLPGLFAIGFALYLPSRYVESLYDLENTTEGFKFLVRYEFGRPGFRPLVIVGEGRIFGGDDTIKKIGGPAGLLVFDDSAAVLECGGRLTRVLGPGFYKDLAPFERVWETVDIRPQRWEYPVGAMTLEGIPVTCMADIRFKIRDIGQEPTKKYPYPMSKNAVLDAVSCKWIRESDRSEPDRRMEWDKRVIISHTEGTLRSILARYPLNQLIEPTGRWEIREQLEQALNESVLGLGAKIIGVELGDITLEDAATQQWIERWQVRKRREAETLIAQGEATRTRLEAEAQSEVKLDMYQRTANILRELKNLYGSNIPPRLIALRFTDMIREIPGNALYLPDDVLKTLKSIEERLASKHISFESKP